MNLMIKNAKVAKCEQCKIPLQGWGKPHLFLLPIFHDDDYEVSKDYYISFCQPIQSTQEIPTGQRACKMIILDCSKCYRRYVQVEDFLMVRGTELLKVFARYDYQRFHQLLHDSSCKSNLGIDKNIAKTWYNSMNEKYFPNYNGDI